MAYIPKTPQDLMLEIPRGNVNGMFSVNKFGANDNVASGTTEDVWDGGGTYAFPSTADITHIAQAADQAALRGGTIEIQGLDANWDLLVQTVDLNATNTSTLVALTTPLIRVFRMKVLENVVGDSNILLTNAGVTADYAEITAGNNQTLMAIYTVPNGYTAYMTSYYVDVVESTGKEPKSTDFVLWVNDNVNGYEFQIKHSHAIPKAGSGIVHNFKPYFKINQKSDIKISASVVDEAGSVHSGFDLIVIEN